MVLYIWQRSATRNDAYCITLQATDYRLGFTADPIAVGIEFVRVWGLHRKVVAVDTVAVPVRCG